MSSFTVNGAYLENSFLRVGLFPTAGEVLPITIGPYGIPIIGLTAGDDREFRLLVRLFEPEKRAEAVLSFDGKNAHTKQPCSLVNSGTIITSDSRRFGWIDQTNGKLTNLTFISDSEKSPILGVIGVAIYTEAPHEAYMIEQEKEDQPSVSGDRGIGSGTSTRAKIVTVEFHRNEPTENPAVVFYALCGDIQKVTEFLEQVTTSAELPRAFTDWHPDLFTR